MRALKIVAISAALNFGIVSAAVAVESSPSAGSEVEFLLAEPGSQDPGEQAAPPVVADPNPAVAPVPDACKNVMLDESQKAAIKASADQFKLDNEALHATAKTAHENLEMVLKRADSTLAEAQAATDALNDSLKPIILNAQKMKLDVLYNVLKPEQREAALSCMAQKMKGHHRGGHKINAPRR